MIVNPSLKQSGIQERDQLQFTGDTLYALYYAINSLIPYKPPVSQERCFFFCQGGGLLLHGTPSRAARGSNPEAPQICLQA